MTSHYELNVYDCSQASAWLECALENSGFDAWIAVGPTPWDPLSESRHAWVIVYLPDFVHCKWVVAIEATVFFPTLANVLRNEIGLLLGEYPGIIYDDGSDTAFRYYHPDDEKYDIYATIFFYGVDDWNWWKVLEEKGEIPLPALRERQ